MKKCRWWRRRRHHKQRLYDECVIMEVLRRQVRTLHDLKVAWFLYRTTQHHWLCECSPDLTPPLALAHEADEPSYSELLARTRGTNDVTMPDNIAIIHWNPRKLTDVN